MSADERIERAGLIYESAVFGGDSGALETADRELDAVEAEIALARGRILHARFLAQGNEDPDELGLFRRALQLYRALGDARGEGEALFWVGCFHQVVRNDNETYALRHLGIAEHTAGRLDAARGRLEESVRLRRELGFLPGVAANLVGLIYVAAAEGGRDDALALAEEAAGIAGASGARGVMRQVEEARSALGGR